MTFCVQSGEHNAQRRRRCRNWAFWIMKPGDRWCLCAFRGQEAFEAGQAPRVVLRATHDGALA